MDATPTLSEQLANALQASAEGTATPEQASLSASVLEALRNNINNPAVVDAISQSVGTFSSVYDLEWAALQPIQKWVREEAAAADRAAPALRSMKAIYEALVTSEKSSGAGLNLGTGQNIVALDAEGRRWLVPRVADKAIDQLMAAEDKKEFKRLVNLGYNAFRVVSGKDLPGS